MSELTDLYQDLILDHGKRPRNMRAMKSANRHAEGFNPLCGDRITIHVHDANGTIDDVSFEGSACAICTASASLMTQRLKGSTAADAEAMFQSFRNMLTGPEADVDQYEGALGKLAALAGVRRYPMRVKCAMLPWHTLKAALDDRDDVVTTE